MNIYYNDGYDCRILENDLGGVDILYKGVILPQYLNKTKHPYPLVFIPHHGEATVHQLVAYATLGVRQRDQVVNHIDNNPYNSRSDNLEYVSRSENAKLAFSQEPRTPHNMYKWEKAWKANCVNVE